MHCAQRSPESRRQLGGQRRESQDRAAKAQGRGDESRGSLFGAVILAGGGGGVERHRPYRDPSFPVFQHEWADSTPGMS